MREGWRERGRGDKGGRREGGGREGGRDEGGVTRDEGGRRTLTPFCSTGTGKLVDGMEVSHRR